MPQKVRIALDAMGGDVGASVVVPGAAISLSRHPDSEFLLIGKRELIEPELARHPALKAVSRVIHTDVAVSMEDKPSQALRRGRKTSSMWLAIDAVKKGEADVAVSAGNTGALMAMARFHLHTLPGIDRPAIATPGWPTLRGESIVLDLGATIGGDARHLVALAIMGAALASVQLNLPRPTVGLLNIGTEEIKGHEEIREAGETPWLAPIWNVAPEPAPVTMVPPTPGLAGEPVTTMESLPGDVRLPMADSFENPPTPLACRSKLMPSVLKFSVWEAFAAVSLTLIVWLPPGPVSVIVPRAVESKAYVPAAAVGAAVMLATVAPLPLAVKVKAACQISKASSATSAPLAACLYDSVTVSP